MKKKNKINIINITFLIGGLVILYVLADIMFALSEQASKDYIQLTREEQEAIKKLSKQCDCKVEIGYDYTIQNGRAIPKIDSNSKYSISLTWEENQRHKSICQQDTGYLSRYALNLLPELLSNMEHIRGYHAIHFHFLVEDKNPINDFSCSKAIIIKR